PRDEARRARPEGARLPNDLQPARPDLQPRRRHGPGDRPVFAGPRQADRPGAAGAGRDPRLHVPRPRRPGRAFDHGLEPRHRRPWRQAQRVLDRPGYGRPPDGEAPGPLRRPRRGERRDREADLRRQEEPEAGHRGPERGDRPGGGRPGQELQGRGGQGRGRPGLRRGEGEAGTARGGLPVMAPILDPKFCSRCGAPMSKAVPPGDSHPRHVCTKCAFIHYLDPKVACGTIAEADGRFVLIERGIDPRKGFWSFPCGFMEIDETTEQAALRETKEETGLDVALEGHLGTYSYP